jgi:hypothetical protein
VPRPNLDDEVKAQSRVPLLRQHRATLARQSNARARRFRRGAHTSVGQLEADIRTFIDRHNENPKPFKWIKSADQILASVKRFCQKTQQTLCGEL